MRKIKIIENNYFNYLKFNDKDFFSLEELKYIKFYDQSIGVSPTPLIQLSSLAKYLKVGNISRSINCC